MVELKAEPREPKGLVISPLVQDPETGEVFWPGGKAYEGAEGLREPLKGLFPPKEGVVTYHWSDVEAAVLSNPKETLVVVSGGNSTLAGMTEKGVSYRHVYDPEGALAFSLYTQSDPRTGDERHAVVFHSPEAGVTAVATAVRTPEGLKFDVKPEDVAPLLTREMEELFKVEEPLGGSRLLTRLREVHQEHEPQLEDGKRLDPESGVVRVDKNTLNTEFGNWEVVVLTLENPKGGSEEYLLLIKGPGDDVYRGGRYAATTESVERVEAALRRGEEVKAAQVVDQDFPNKVEEIVKDLVHQGHLTPEHVRKLADVLPPDARKEVEELSQKLPERDRGRELSF